MIRALKAPLALCALVALGLGLHWVTAGSIAAASTHDLTSMASLTVGAVAWVAYTWLVLAVLATALEQLPGTLGRAATAVTSRITSQTSRTLLRSALGVAAITPLTIGVAHATPEAPNHHPSPTTDWRSPEQPSTLRLTELTPPRPDRPQINRPSGQLGERSANQDERPPGRVGVPDRPTIGAPTRYTDLRSGQAIRPTTRVVGPGESLWSIAAAELGPTATTTQIATRWPDWYAANRILIGPDPNLIRPGQGLRTPAPAVHPVPPTHQEK